jgi:hypothetical protein
LTDQFKTHDIALLSGRLQASHPIILGSNSCRNFNIQDPKSGETLFRAHWVDSQLHLEARLYDHSGNLIAVIAQNCAPILYSDAVLCCNDSYPKIFFYSDPDLGIGQHYLRIGDSGFTSFNVVASGEIVLSGRTTPTGHTLFEGLLRNKEGTVVCRIAKSQVDLGGFNFVDGTFSHIPPFKKD